MPDEVKKFQIYKKLPTTGYDPSPGPIYFPWVRKAKQCKT